MKDSNRLIAAALVAAALAFRADAGELTQYPIGAPEKGASQQRMRAQNASTLDSVPTATPLFSLYPAAGISGRDFILPYLVDLDPGSGLRDKDCGTDTFNGHDGHDVYIRSFREQDIGIPVFAPADALVIAIHDGETDQNTIADANLRANSVVLLHRDNIRTEYVHLKKNSILVRVGQLITAGTEIGRIGSSGPSTSPHLHFGVAQGESVIEPLSGPCRPGDSYFVSQPSTSKEIVVLGTQFSSQPFSSFAPPPFDDSPRTGTYLLGTQRIYFKADLAHLPAGARYTIYVDSPRAGRIFTTSGSIGISTSDSRLMSELFTLDVPLNDTGNWTLTLLINNVIVATAPFNVVSTPSEVVNRPPSPFSVTLEPVGLTALQAPVCRVFQNDPADPDYDLVTYQYEWRVGETVVRSTTSAAHTDSLGREYVRPGSGLSCRVTASDRTTTSQPQSAFAWIAGRGRNRPVRR